MSGRGLTLESFTAASVVLVAATTAAVLLSGLVPVLPWNLLLLVAIIGLPFALCFHYLSQRDRARPFTWAACLAMSGAVLLGWHHFVVWPLAALAIWALPGSGFRVGNARAVWCATVTLVCGYGSVWNANYLLARHMSHDRWDPLMRETDLWFYRAWFGDAVDLTGMFPLVDNPILLQAFDNAYAILIPEVILVAFLMSQTGESWRLRIFLQRLFGFYVTGIAIYMCFPVNGPSIYFPSQQDLARSLPGTVMLAQGMLHDYRAAQAGGQLRGFGYFIAVPSLHVLAAMFLQHCLYPFRGLFRVFLPVNAVLCLSTVVLGYHYLLDVVAAILVYLVFLAVSANLTAVPTHHLGATGSMRRPLA